MRFEFQLDEGDPELRDYLVPANADVAALKSEVSQAISEYLASLVMPPEKALAIAQLEAAEEACREAIRTGQTYSRDELLQIAAVAAMGVN